MRKINRLVIKAEPWQILFLFIGAILLYSLTPNEQAVLKIITSILLAVVIFGWFLILGMSLNENLPEDQQMSDTFFIISCFYGILLVSLSAILRNVSMGEDMIGYVIMLLVLFGFSFFYIIYFTSTLFTSNQEHLSSKDKLRAEVIFILFIGFILGILILQSRIRKFFV